MRKLFLILATLAALVLGGGVACAADKAGEKPEFGYLKKWEHLLPHKTQDLEDERPAHPAIWDDPKVKESMMKTLGAERFRQVTVNSGSYGVVHFYNDFLYFSAYNAPPEKWQPEARVYINLKDASVKVCWEDETADYWLTPDGSSRHLTNGYCDDRDYKKIYREQNGADRESK